MPYPQFRRSRSHKFTIRSAGTVTATTTWAAVDTGLDITLSAQTGDVLQAGVSTFWDNAATYGRLDCVLIPSGTVTSSFSGTYVAANATNGVNGWLGNTGTYTPIGASVMKTVVASDVVGGLTTCRLMLRSDTAGKLLIAQASDPLQFWVKNLGPVQP